MKPAIKSAFQSIISYHLDQYPGMEIEDVYKLVFQAAMGSEHAVVDKDQVEHRLKAEVETMMPQPDQSLIDPVSPDQQLIRVNLYPFTTRGGKLNRLADAFIETSRAYQPSVANLITYWEWVVEMAGTDNFAFSPGDLGDYGALQQAQQYPAVHHSPAYRRLHQPAYRVVLRDQIRLPIS